MVYTPDDEPYLGLESVYHFDKVIVLCMEQNEEVARYTHDNSLNELQQAASQIIPQGINVALTIRELVRQGYLFGALILIRPLIERAATISYLCEKPDEMGKWKMGWEIGKRPSFNKMLETMSGITNREEIKEIANLFHHIVHGDPIGSEWNLIEMNHGRLGHTVGKNIEDDELCDFICVHSYLMLIVLMERMAQVFPKTD